MEYIEKTLRVMTPSEGMVLTQNEDVEIVKRIFTDKVYLGAQDRPGNWREITEEEALKLKEEQHAEIAAIMAREEKERKKRELEEQLKALEDEE